MWQKTRDAGHPGVGRGREMEKVLRRRKCSTQARGALSGDLAPRAVLLSPVSSRLVGL